MLSFATVRRRRASFLGPFTALFLGVTILSMTALVLTSARPRVPERYAGAGVVVQSPAVDQSDGTFTDSRPWPASRARELVAGLASVPGVAAAVPDRSFYVQAVVGGEPVGNPGADLRGHPWPAAALGPDRLTAGRAPEDGTQAVVPASLGVQPGGRVTLLTAGGPATYTVSGTVGSTAFYLSAAAAERLAPGVRIIGLVLEPGADPAAVATAATGVVGGAGKVLTGESLTQVEAKVAAETRWIGMQILIAMASLTVFVSVFVVASTFSFGIVQRRRELGLLRTVGATPRQIRRTVYGEALIVGVAAALAGVALGVPLAPALGRLLVSGGLEPVGFTVVFRPLPLVGAFVLGLAVALAGVGAAARRAARIAPLEALREAALEKRPMTRGRWIGATGCTGLGLLLVVLAATGDSDESSTTPCTRPWR